MSMYKHRCYTTFYTLLSHWVAIYSLTDKQQTKKRKRRTKDGKENAGKPKKQKTGRGINAIIHLCIYM